MMVSSSDPVDHKESFLQRNQFFSEIELTDESKSIGKLREIDLAEDEVWLLQCPKGMDINELQNQKLKIPGRSNVNNNEAVSIEFNEGKEQHAFAYCNRKRRFALRLLPVRGTIFLRERLKAAEAVSTERAEECCPPAKRVPLPKSIRVRHPLLGAQYEDKLQLDKNIAKRLQRADQISAEILKERLNQKRESNLVTRGNSFINQGNTIFPIEINSDDTDAVEFVSEDKLKMQKKNKRKHSESKVEKNCSKDNFTNKNKISKNEEESVLKDLQWLQNI